MTPPMFPPWASFGATTIVCWIKICAVSPDGGVDVGRVAAEDVLSVLVGVAAGATVGMRLRTTRVIRRVKHKAHHRRTCCQSIVHGRTMVSRS